MSGSTYTNQLMVFVNGKLVKISAADSLAPPAARRCAVVSVYNARTEEKVIDLGAGEGAVHAVSISPLCVSPPHEAPRFLSVACRA